MDRTAVGGYYGGSNGYYGGNMTSPIRRTGGYQYGPPVQRYGLPPQGSRGLGRMYPSYGGMQNGTYDGMQNGMYGGY